MIIFEAGVESIRCACMSSTCRQQKSGHHPVRTWLGDTHQSRCGLKPGRHAPQRCR